MIFLPGKESKEERPDDKLRLTTKDKIWVAAAIMAIIIAFVLVVILDI
jgi:hypothetical protein